MVVDENSCCSTPLAALYVFSFPDFGHSNTCAENTGLNTQKKNGFQDIGHQAMKNHYPCKIENKWDELFYCPSRPPGGFLDNGAAKGNPGEVQPSPQINLTEARVPEKTRQLESTEHSSGEERATQDRAWSDLPSFGLLLAKEAGRRGWGGGVS